MHRTALLAFALAISATTIGAVADADPAAPAKHALSAAAAHQLAARLANSAIEARTDLKHPDGSKIRGDLKPERFTGAFAKGRWSLEVMPPDGLMARISFDELGEHEKVWVDYSPG